jgi:hypothetical protein
VATVIFAGQTGTAIRETFRPACMPTDMAPEEQGLMGPAGILPSPLSSARKDVVGQNFPMISTTQTQESKNEVSPLIRLSRGEVSQRRFKVLQQWEGIVDSLGSDSLTADLIDLTDREKPREIVEIPMVEFADADQHLLFPGCVFYWIIGYEISLGGGKSRVSEIRVRRNPEWSQNALDSIKARGKELYQTFKNDVEISATEPR